MLDIISSRLIYNRKDWRPASSLQPHSFKLHTTQSQCMCTSYYQWQSTSSAAKKNSGISSFQLSLCSNTSAPIAPQFGVVNLLQGCMRSKTACQCGALQTCPKNMPLNQVIYLTDMLNKFSEIFRDLGYLDSPTGAIMLYPYPHIMLCTALTRPHTHLNISRVFL